MSQDRSRLRLLNEQSRIIRLRFTADSRPNYASMRCRFCPLLLADPAEPSSGHPLADGDPARRRPARHELEITLSGARLGDAQEIIYYQPGITTVGLKKLDDNSVRAKIKIAPDCLLGLHDVRVRTATGISELRTFSVGLSRKSTRSSRTTTSRLPRRSR